MIQILENCEAMLVSASHVQMICIMAKQEPTYNV